MTATGNQAGPTIANVSVVTTTSETNSVAAAQNLDLPSGSAPENAASPEGEIGIAPTSLQVPEIAEGTSNKLTKPSKPPGDGGTTLAPLQRMTPRQERAKQAFNRLLARRRKLLKRNQYPGNHTRTGP